MTKLSPIPNFYFSSIPYYIYKLNQRIMSWVKLSHFKHYSTIHETVKLSSSAEIENIRGLREAICISNNCIVSGQLLTFAHGGQISIGEWCYVGENSKIWSACNITIGNRVLISHSVNIHDTNSHPLNSYDRHVHFIEISSSGHPNEITNISSAPIFIENDVWIGFNATILKGVRIGEGAIVGACSVVTDDVPPYTIVAGNPARVVRKLQFDK